MSWPPWPLPAPVPHPWYQLPLGAVPGLFDLLPSLLMFEPPQIQGLHEGLGQQRAHCLHQAMAELQVLFQRQ